MGALVTFRDDQLTHRPLSGGTIRIPAWPEHADEQELARAVEGAFRARLGDVV